MQPTVSDLGAVDLPRVFAGMAARPYALWLDSADTGAQAGRYSFLCCDPVQIMRIDALVPDAFDRVRAALGPAREALPGLPPFQGGAAGLFSYDLARGLEALPATAPQEFGAPALAVGIYDQILAADHRTGKAWLITHGDKARHDAFLRRFVDRPPALPKPPPTLRLAPTLPPAEYEARAERVRAHILDGDIFQANLSQRFTGTFEGAPAAHYLALRARNPAPMAGYFDAGGCVVASASPERFLRATPGGRVEACPIKGTAPRGADPAALLASEKDRAENTMIVDLLRNDLSRVCEDESVEVAALCALESFAQVHHLVSTVTGRLAPGRDALDLLRACWPGGSVTGAPKIRAMEIIEALEDARRGPYCGSLGYIGFDGAMDTSILIRTLVLAGGRASLRTGGGITLASDPAAEVAETLAKAAGMT